MYKLLLDAELHYVKYSFNLGNFSTSYSNKRYSFLRHTLVNYSLAYETFFDPHDTTYRYR